MDVCPPPAAIANDCSAPGRTLAASRRELVLAQDCLADLAGLGSNRAAASDAGRRDLNMTEAGCTERVAAWTADVAAAVAPGVDALLTLEDRGADVRPAALALWREFSAARAALAALALHELGA